MSRAIRPKTLIIVQSVVRRKGLASHTHEAEACAAQKRKEAKKRIRLVLVDGQLLVGDRLARFAIPRVPLGQLRSATHGNAHVSRGHLTSNGTGKEACKGTRQIQVCMRAART